MTELAQVLADLQLCRSRHELHQSAAKASLCLGSDWFLLVNETVHADGEVCRMVLSNVPEAFQSEYRAKYPAADDPLTRAAFRSTLPVLWTDDQSPEVQEFAAAAERHGAFLVMAVQQFEPRGRSTVCSFWSRQRASAPSDDVQATGMLVASYVHVAAQGVLERRRLHDNGRYELTGVENRCLTLLARGIPAREIARTLGIPPRTVTYYVSRATQKMAAWRPRQAITQALIRGDITTSDLSPRPWTASNEFVNLHGRERAPVPDHSAATALLGDVRRAPRFTELARAISRGRCLLEAPFFAFVARIPWSFGRSFQCVLTNYPPELAVLAEEELHYLHDPAFGGGAFRGTPLHWDEFDQLVDERESRALKETHARTSGVSCMTRTPGGTTSILSLAGVPRRSIDARGLRRSIQLAREVHERCLQLVCSGAAGLSGSELSCLQILAAGYGQKHIADSLGCSERAARYKIRNAVDKMGVATSQAAVSLAISRGLVCTSHALARKRRFRVTFG